jgi:hypothetical protein
VEQRQQVRISGNRRRRKRARGSAAPARFHCEIVKRPPHTKRAHDITYTPGKQAPGPYLDMKEQGNQLPMKREKSNGSLAESRLGNRINPLASYLRRDSIPALRAYVSAPDRSSAALPSSRSAISFACLVAVPAENGPVATRFKRHGCRLPATRTNHRASLCRAGTVARAPLVVFPGLPA